MKNKFPYPGIAKKVTKEMCDLNGHMNVTFYTKIFEEGSYEMFNQFSTHQKCGRNVNLPKPMQSFTNKGR